MLLWIDTETTGLDTSSCKLLEVALVVTTNELDVCWEHDWVLPFASDDPARAGVHEVVEKMHSANGLWGDCDVVYRSAVGAYGINGDARVFSDIESEIERELRKWTERGTTPICGSTIAFDRAVLNAKMPRVGKHFHYRNLDVSVFTELASRWYQKAYDGRPTGGGHRALADITVSINLMKYWRAEVLK